ncbi:sigma-70 family RNA polymerase sigma factor [Ammoniphilus sp. YIM 78166]|uniref:sigma-70 family RNA polymerase sigma factor n=1 Tax=Ammoniphilus sp. YIM 78166 TaxID=1644106 RepID=UPI001F0F09D7|nr:sigma-70 family RNA polymerase sigma factor [Ammoniphilus sp. YIM 78166]
MDQASDLHELINRAISGNRAAFGELYEQTIKQVYQTIHFLVEEKSEAEDIVQEVYIQLHKSLPKYDVQRPFQPWLMGIVMKQIHSYRRKRWMNFRILYKSAVYEKEPVAGDFSERIVEDLSHGDLLEGIYALPFKLKQIIILHYFNEYKQDEMAEILDIPIGTVKSRTHSALKKLRQENEEKKITIRKVEERHEY